MAKAHPGIRVVIQLDPRVALEGVILNRHRQLPVNRRQEWLRGLLVQGFRFECDALRCASDDAKRNATTAFANWIGDKSKQPVDLRESEPAVLKAEIVPVKAANKPFATLGKVMG